MFASKAGCSVFIRVYSKSCIAKMILTVQSNTIPGMRWDHTNMETRRAHCGPNGFILTFLLDNWLAA